MYNAINAPLTLHGLTLKNRLVFAPTTMGLKEDEYFAKLQAIAAGGTALVIIGDVPVCKGGFGPNLHTHKGFAFYSRLTAMLHKNDCLAAAQLHQSDSDIKGMLRYIPGVLTGKISQAELRPLLNSGVSDYISGLPTAKVRRITAAFGAAATLAKQAGFDMVQIHGDRMCGSFSSSLFNHRTDEYGGSPENRARFALEAVRAVRAAQPDLPIDYKLAVRLAEPHYGNAGILPGEIAAFVPALEQAGVDSFHVALANHGNLEDTIPPAGHPYFKGEGCFLPFCDEVKKYTRLPVCGVGRLTSPDFIEKQLAAGRIDLAGMSRQLLADPEWLNKLNAGAAGSIHRCTACNRACLGGIQAHQGVHCIYEKIEENSAHTQAQQPA